MNTTWIKHLTGAAIVGATMISANLHAQEDMVVVIPDKGDALKLKATGRMQFQTGYVDQENDVKSGDWSTFEVRRARIGLSGSFANDIKGKVEANIVPGSVSVRSAFVTWAKSDLFSLTGGYDKPKSSLEENTSSASIITVERSNVNNNIAAPGQSVGVWASGESGPMFYQVGLYNGEGGSTRNESGVEAEYMFNAHGGVALELSENSDVTLMVSYLQSDDPNASLGYEDTTVASLHFEAGAFDLRTEYFMGADGDDDTTGFYIMPSIMLSEALEAVARYEIAESDSGSGIRAQSRYARRTDIVEIDEDTTADRGDDFNALYVGMNYYFQKYNKVMLGVEFSELENTEAGTLDTTTLFGAYRVRF